MLSQWLYAAIEQAGLAVELLETRHVYEAFKSMPVKSDRNDARKIAQLMRLGWFRPVHCKSITAQEIRAMLTARKLVQPSMHDYGNCICLPVSPSSDMRGLRELPFPISFLLVHSVRLASRQLL
jgi:Transposase